MNKVEKIKAYLERRIAEITDISQGYTANKQMSTEYLLLFELLAYIDSLSDTEKDFGIKESVIPFGASDSELMEATYFIPQGYHAVIESNKVIIKKGEEPVSNDLEEAAHSYVDTTIEWFDSEGNPCCYPAFIAGAQWQKERDQSTIELAEDHAYLAGQEKIIAKACEWLENYFKGVSSGTVYLEDFKKAIKE